MITIVICCCYCCDTTRHYVTLMGIVVVTRYCAWYWFVIVVVITIRLLRLIVVGEVVLFTGLTTFTFVVDIVIGNYLVDCWLTYVCWCCCPLHLFCDWLLLTDVLLPPVVFPFVDYVRWLLVLLPDLFPPLLTIACWVGPHCYYLQYVCWLLRCYAIWHTTGVVDLFILRPHVLIRCCCYTVVTRWYIWYVLFWLFVCIDYTFVDLFICYFVLHLLLTIVYFCWLLLFIHYLLLLLLFLPFHFVCIALSILHTFVYWPHVDYWLSHVVIVTFDLLLIVTHTRCCWLLLMKFGLRCYDLLHLRWLLHICWWLILLLRFLLMTGCCLLLLLPFRLRCSIDVAFERCWPTCCYGPLHCLDVVPFHCYVTLLRLYIDLLITHVDLRFTHALPVVVAHYDCYVVVVVSHFTFHIYVCYVRLTTSTVPICVCSRLFTFTTFTTFFRCCWCPYLCLIVDLFAFDS